MQFVDHNAPLSPRSSGIGTQSRNGLHILHGFGVYERGTRAHIRAMDRLRTTSCVSGNLRAAPKRSAPVSCAGDAPCWARAENDAGDAPATKSPVVPKSAASLDDRVLLTLSEAARALSVSVRSLQRLVAAGRIPAVRLGRSVRLRVEDIRNI